MINTNGMLLRINERTRLIIEITIISHFSFLKIPVLILLKNKSPVTTENVAGSQIPRRFKIEEGCSIPFIKIDIIAKIKTTTE